jgi:D-3-phosphoglycerate dehydrogenase / 2-oxoglutarate reductase
MKVLIADKLAASSIKQLEALGCQVTNNPELSAETLPVAIADFDVLIVRSTKVSAAVIEASTGLSLIVRAGAGVNTIDLAAASQRGIHVTNCPGKNTEAVAELAIGLLIAADRRIPQAGADLAQQAWKKGEYGKARGLKGRTLGIIGLGNIARAVIARAKGLEMNIVAWSRSLTPETAEAMGITCAATPLEVAAQADAVSVHVAYAKATTHHLINAEFLAAMKKGAILINTSRGEVLDTAALKAAIREKGLRVGLDVFENEPKGSTDTFADSELAQLAICTPHIGASTDQASEAIADETVRIVKSYIETGLPLNVVNLRGTPVTTHGMVVRHYNRVGVLAMVLDALKAQGVNVEEMQNSIFAGGMAATCSLRLDTAPQPAIVAELVASPDIIQVSTH